MLAKVNPFFLYVLMIIVGIIAGLTHVSFVHSVAHMISEIFINIFKCISIPIIFLSIIVTLSSHASSAMNQVLRRTAFYTLITTVIAASISCLLYLLIQPMNVDNFSHNPQMNLVNNVNYLHYVTNIIPANFLTPFIENQVISVLLIGILIGIAIRYIPEEEGRKTIINFFKGTQGFFFVITKWVVAILPIGLFGFITTTIVQIESGVNLKGLGQYITVIIAANLIQGFFILSAWLKLNGIPAFKTMRSMMPALSMAFFSKSSAGTLPITIATAEKNLHINPQVSRFVLPLCTNINMNGCAAFIFTTVIYLMQNNGITITLATMGLWILIATVAAIGNAGVPMGCFFLSASLLSSMNVPIELLGLILPIYSVIDMIETTLNVWSDSCVAAVIDREGEMVNSQIKLVTG